ncbi:MAG: hypothetical protein Q9M10_04905 [Mariprofundaceae bacterium]|nr:hypothetical protein [Mariprofundaceae bacterium]
MKNTLAAIVALTLITGPMISPVMAQENPCNPCSMKHMKKMNPCSMKTMPNPCSMKKKTGSSDMTKSIRPQAFNSFQSAVDMGRKLWNDDKGMGKAGVACLSCHADFDMLHFDKHQNFPHYVKMVGDVVTLDQMINYCLLNPMQGHELAQNSKEMTAMAAYYRAYRMKYLQEHRQ